MKIAAGVTALMVAGWKALYEVPKAPFSWEPETVEVIDSSDLAVSRGPVFNPEGKRIGTFTKIRGLLGTVIP